MANRSYLYTADGVPGHAPGPGRIEDLSEWNWQVPILHRVLLTGAPKLCPSTIWESPVLAIAGDYDTGVANLERFFAALPQTDEVRANTASALEVLQNPARRRNQLLLEVGEIVALTVSADKDEDYHAWATEITESTERELAEIGSIDDWIAYAATIDPSELDEATGAGYWPQVTYFSHSATTAPPESEQPETQTAALPEPESPPAPPPGSPPPAPEPQPSIPAHWIPTPVATGTVAWAIGLVVLVFVPVLPSLAAGLLMGLIGRAQRGNGPIAAANGRYAGNWGFTYLLLSVILWTAHFVLFFTTTSDGPGSNFYPLGIPVIIWAALTVGHLVICIIGIARANRGKVFKVPAIGFLRG